jgi:hypothetical protein
MQKILAENKRLQINFDGEALDQEQLIQKKESLLDEIERTSDESRRHQLRIEIAGVISGIDALSTAHKNVDSVGHELQLRQTKRRQEEIDAAGQAMETFRYNCELIAREAYPRLTGERDPGPWSDQLQAWHRKVFPYFQKLLQQLSFEDAQKQADEIFNAMHRPAQYGLEHRPNRKWEVVIALPKPDRAARAH